jgi:YHS domain-containing protein
LKNGCPEGQRAEHLIDQDAAGVAIKGYDPVAYFKDGQPVKGSPEIDYVWKGAHWHFATQDNRDAFSKDPERFGPQYGGYCANGMSMNVLADIDPDSWAIVDGRLYLNHSKRAVEKFRTTTTMIISKAGANWPGLQPKQ